VGKLEFEKIEKNKVLLVEGMDEVNVLNQFFKAIPLVYAIQIIPYLNIPEFDNFMRAFRKRQNYSIVESIGILRDADENAEAAFQSVQDALVKAEFEKPEEPLKSYGSKPKISVMILPDNKNKGALESLLLQTVEKKDEIICVEKFIECLKEKQLLKSEFTSRIAKAKLHAYIASKEEPGLKIGEASKANYWDFNSPAFDQIISFLQML
jgi:hypothetical protein